MIYRSLKQEYSQMYFHHVKDPYYRGYSNLYDIFELKNKCTQGSGIEYILFSK